MSIAELCERLDLYVQQANEGERLTIADDNGPIAELGPLTFGPDLERLIAQGKVSRPTRRGLPEPLEMGDDPARAQPRAG